jgi:hypothetical protein
MCAVTVMGHGPIWSHGMLCVRSLAGVQDAAPARGAANLAFVTQVLPTADTGSLQQRHNGTHVLTRRSNTVLDQHP